MQNFNPLPRGKAITTNRRVTHHTLLAYYPTMTRTSSDLGRVYGKGQYLVTERKSSTQARPGQARPSRLASQVSGHQLTTLTLH